MLFDLLASGADLGPELITSILGAIRLLTLDDRHADTIVTRGILPIAALLSNSNEYVLTQALFVFLNLARFGTTYPVVRTFVDSATLSELVGASRSRSSAVSLLATQLKFFLGL
jgi:hypothetical protein